MTRQALNPPIEKGQFVYLRCDPKGTNKIQDEWDPTLYQVENTPGPDGAVYTVVLAHGNGPPKSKLNPDETLSKDSTAMSGHKSFQSFQSLQFQNK